MATTAPSEPKPEAKAEENQEHLKYKTWMLRVSIHCEGCKKKVKKILKNIDGVYTTNIDLRQQKVIVIGDIDSETLIRKLENNGKHAELWPESQAVPKKKKKKKSKSKNKEKQQQQQQQSDQESSDEGNNPSEVKVEEPSKNKEIDNGGAVSVNKINEVCSTSKAGGQTVTFSAGTQSPVGGESEGGGGKKKKKKGHKGNNGNGNVVIGEGEPSGGDSAPAGTGSPVHGPHGPSLGPYPFPASYSPPRHIGYQYPQYPPATQYYYTPRVYAGTVSNNTAYLRPSYNTLYCAAPTSYSYPYKHPATGSEIAPSDVDSYSSQPSDSFEIFSDENPNACSIM